MRYHRPLWIAAASLLMLTVSTRAQESADIKIALVRTLSKHKNSVFSIAASPDGRRLLSAGFDKQIILWDTKTSKPIAINKDPQGLMLWVAFSPDGKQAFASGDPKQALVMSLPSLRTERRLKVPYRAVRLAIDSTSPRVAISGNKTAACDRQSMQKRSTGWRSRRTAKHCSRPAVRNPPAIVTNADPRKLKIQLQDLAISPEARFLALAVDTESSVFDRKVSVMLYDIRKWINEMTATSTQ